MKNFYKIEQLHQDFPLDEVSFPFKDTCSNIQKEEDFMPFKQNSTKMNLNLSNFNCSCTKCWSYSLSYLVNQRLLMSDFIPLLKLNILFKVGMLSLNKMLQFADAIKKINTIRKITITISAKQIMNQEQSMWLYNLGNSAKTFSLILSLKSEQKNNSSIITWIIQNLQHPTSVSIQLEIESIFDNNIPKVKIFQSIERLFHSRNQRESSNENIESSTKIKTFKLKSQVDIDLLLEDKDTFTKLAKQFSTLDYLSLEIPSLASKQHRQQLGLLSQALEQSQSLTKLVISDPKCYDQSSINLFPKKLQYLLVNNIKMDFQQLPTSLEYLRICNNNKDALPILENGYKLRPNGKQTHPLKILLVDSILEMKEFPQFIQKFFPSLMEMKISLLCLNDTRLFEYLSHNKQLQKLKIDCEQVVSRDLISFTKMIDSFPHLTSLTLSLKIYEQIGIDFSPFGRHLEYFNFIYEGPQKSKSQIFSLVMNNFITHHQSIRIIKCNIESKLKNIFSPPFNPDLDYVRAFKLLNLTFFSLDLDEVIPREIMLFKQLTDCRFQIIQQWISFSKCIAPLLNFNPVYCFYDIFS